MTIFGTLWPKQNNPVMLLRHNGENKHLATPLSMYFLDILVMDLFPLWFTKSLLLLLLPYFGFLFRSQLRQTWHFMRLCISVCARPSVCVQFCFKCMDIFSLDGEVHFLS